MYELWREYMVIIFPGRGSGGNLDFGCVTKEF